MILLQGEGIHENIKHVGMHTCARMHACVHACMHVCTLEHDPSCVNIKTEHPEIIGNEISGTDDKFKMTYLFCTPQFGAVLFEETPLPAE